MAVTEGRWLSMGRACLILGVNETTLRHWADMGRVRTFRTPGGHRRFSREDIYALTEGKAGPQPADAGSNGARALDRVRRRISRRKGQGDVWLRPFDEAGKVRMRVLGRRLVALALEYLGKRRRRGELYEEALHLGMDYGRELAARGIVLGEALSVFVRFRGFLHEALRHSPGLEHGTRNGDLWGVLELEDQVLLGMATAYEGRGEPLGSPQASRGAQ